MVANAHLSDGRDQAAFVLNLSRTGGDVVPHRHGTAFLVNAPAHAKRVLDADDDEYQRAYHPYRELAAYYRPTGAYLLGLGRDGHGPAMALRSRPRSPAQPSRRWRRCCSGSGVACPCRSGGRE